MEGACLLPCNSLHAHPYGLYRLMDNKSQKRDGQAEISASAFGARLRVAASRTGLSAADLGRMADIAKQSMSAYWNGTRLCGTDRLFSLADILGVDARWLVEGDAPDGGEAGEEKERLVRAFARLDGRRRAVLIDVAEVMAGLPGPAADPRPPGTGTPGD